MSVLKRSNNTATVGGIAEMSKLDKPDALPKPASKTINKYATEDDDDQPAERPQFIPE